MTALNTTPESNKFYKKLFNFINLNHALTLAGYSRKYICDMDDVEYHSYIIELEYLHQKGVIDLGPIIGK